MPNCRRLAALATLMALVTVPSLTGCSIASLVSARGEAFFRDAESVVLAECLGSGSGVLSTGGVRAVGG